MTFVSNIANVSTNTPPAINQQQNYCWRGKEGRDFMIHVFLSGNLVTIVTVTEPFIKRTKERRVSLISGC